MEQAHFYVSKFGYPPDLQKAVDDPFGYLIVLSTREQIFCVQVKAIDANWIRIEKEDLVECLTATGESRRLFGVECARGVTIAVSHIVAVLDAPNGS